MIFLTLSPRSTLENGLSYPRSSEPSVSTAVKIHNRVAIGLLAGGAVGAYFGEDASVLEPLGTLFIKLIRMVIVPLIASSLIMAIAGLPGRAALGRMGLRALGFIVVSLFVALLIGYRHRRCLAPGCGALCGREG